MTIFATRVGNDQSLANIKVKLQQPIPDNSTLVYSKQQRCFTLQSTDNVLPAITGASNLGGTNSTGLYSSKSGSILQFKEIIAGAGITITNNPENLTIRANVAADRLSVQGSYKVTINNISSSDTAYFQLYTAVGSSTNPIIISPQSMIPVTVNNLYTGNENNQGYIQTTNGFDFIGHGFKAGMWISLSGTASQNGFWQIASVVNTTPVINGVTNTVSTIYFTQEFTGDFSFNLGGPQYPTTIKEGDFVVLPPDSTLSYPFDPLQKYELTSFTQDFGPSGYNLQTGMIFKLSGAQAVNGISPDGNYTIYSVRPKTTTLPSMIIVSPNNPFLCNAGPLIEANPLVGSIKITVNSTEVSTGFAVDQFGNIAGTTLSTTGQITMGSPNIQMKPTQNNDLVRKDYVDNAVSGVTGKTRLFYFANINS